MLLYVASIRFRRKGYAYVESGLAVSKKNDFSRLNRSMTVIDNEGRTVREYSFLAASEPVRFYDEMPGMAKVIDHRPAESPTAR